MLNGECSIHHSTFIFLNVECCLRECCSLVRPAPHTLSQVAESTDNLYVLRSQLGGRESTEMAEGVLDLTHTIVNACGRFEKT